MSQEPERVNDSSDTVKQRIASIERGDVSWKSYSDQWNENHGTLLMGFAALIFLVGVGVLAYQQNRFRPVAFPAAKSFPLRSSEDAEGSHLDESTLDSEETIRLLVSGGLKDGGPLRVAVYTSEQSFNQPNLASWKNTVSLDDEGVAQCVIPAAELTEPFAIAVYQDNNDNNQLDRGLLGIPSERYGFSNAARGKLGPPSFAEATVARPEPGVNLEIAIW